MNFPASTSSVDGTSSAHSPQYPNDIPRETPSSGLPRTLPVLPIILNRSLADVPFTHQGVLGGRATSDVNMSYDRLEFLGDAYIELIATRLLFLRFPELPAGRLSQKREFLVKNETLAEFSLAYGFDRKANIPKFQSGEQDKSKVWTKIMGDVFEAYVAAVILSDPADGFTVAETWLTGLWEPKISQPDNIGTWDPNAKVQLANRIMGKGIKIQYRDEAPPDVIKKEGKIVFHVGVYLTGWGWENTHLGSGSGLNKNIAGSQAATKALSNSLTAQIEAIKRKFDTKRLSETCDKIAGPVNPELPVG